MGRREHTRLLDPEQLFPGASSPPLAAAARGPVLAAAAEGAVDVVAVELGAAGRPPLLGRLAGGRVHGIFGREERSVGGNGPVGREDGIALRQRQRREDCRGHRRWSRLGDHGDGLGVVSR